MFRIRPGSRTDLQFPGILGNTSIAATRAALLTCLQCTIAFPQTANSALVIATESGCKGVTVAKAQTAA